MIPIPNYIPIGISHYFFAGFSRQKCLENLLKSHEKNPKVFPKIEISEVNFWYDSFENGNFDLEQNYPKVLSVPESLSLEELPKKRQKLDQEADSPKVFEDILLALVDNRLFVTGAHDTDYIKYIYEKTGPESHQVFEKKKEPKQYCGDYLDAGFSMFKSMIDGNIRVKCLKFRYKTGYKEAELKPYIERIARIMGELKGLLHVEKLCIPSITAMDIDPVFEKILPGSLKNLVILFIGSDDKKFAMMSGMKNLKAHWEYLDEFESMDGILDLPIDSFSHIKDVRVELASITEEQVLRYKEKILQLGTISRHVISSDKQNTAIRDAAFSSYTLIHLKDFNYRNYQNDDDKAVADKNKKEKIGIIPFSDPTKGCLMITFIEFDSSILYLDGRKAI